MRYINKNHIVAAKVIKDKDTETWEICFQTNGEELFTIFRDTKEECIALAEKLELTLID